MMEVSMKNLLLQIESNSIRDSCMRFCGGGRVAQRDEWMGVGEGGIRGDKKKQVKG